jgi:SAM-dependent methyltransferase
VADVNIHSRCRVCHHDGVAADSVRVPGATRDVQREHFTVWRCASCASLNALEAIDFDRVYRDYPIQRQRYDFFARLLFAKRLRILRRAGLERQHRVLDYGCGSGHFVRYLLEQGFQCAGYDPYNDRYDDESVLTESFDVVTCQDVIEHADEPAAFLQTLAALVSPMGVLVVGTPYADHVSLHDVIDQLGVLHQPFHRFVIARQQVTRLFRLPGWGLREVIEACYIDTAFPFANTMFLFHLFKSGGGLMDFAFEPIPATHFLRHPSLLFWGLFGRLFARRQDLFVVMSRHGAGSAAPGASGKLSASIKIDPRAQ